METELGAAQKDGVSVHGFGPVVAAGGAAVLILALLLVGGFDVVSHAFAPRATPAVARQAPVAGADGKDKADGTGTSAAGPTAPPERVSAPTPAQQADTVRYIHSGDTLSQISRETGVSVDRLAQYNAIQEVDRIYADSALRIPYLVIPGKDAAAAAQK